MFTVQNYRLIIEGGRIFILHVSSGERIGPFEQEDIAVRRAGLTQNLKGVFTLTVVEK